MEYLRKSIKKAAQRLRGGAGAPDFWALVRALENGAAAKPRIGCAKHPAEENVRFGQMPFLTFPPTDIAEIIEGGRAAGVDATIIVYFFGLLGVNGPMPLEFTNYVFRRSRNYFDNTWRRFLDIIHHRFLTFYYRAFAAKEQAISFDRREDDPVSGIIKSLTGFSPGPNLPEREERLLLQSAARFSFLAKTRGGLEDILRRAFGCEVKVRDFIPSSYDIPSECYALLGRQSAVLGVNLQIGRTYMSITGKFEIRIGPLSFDEYMQFVDDREGLDFLSGAAALYLDRPLDYSVVFVIRRDTIPLARLGFDLEEARWVAPQLGYTCWIGQAKESLVTLAIAAALHQRENHRNRITKE